MGTTIQFFVKIFACEEYRDEFLKGNLYMNPIYFFRKLEEEHASNVGDEHEALSSWLQPNGKKIVLGFPGEEIVLTEKDLAGPITLRRERFDAVNVFCLMHLHSNGVSFEDAINEEQLIELQKNYNIPDSANKLGDFAIAISNIDEFLQRVQVAAQKLVDNSEAIRLKGRPVTYYDEQGDLRLANEDDAIFHKQKSYGHQKEFRISLDRGVQEIEPYILKVGDLTDIAFPAFTKDIKFSFVK